MPTAWLDVGIMEGGNLVDAMDAVDAIGAVDTTLGASHLRTALGGEIVRT